MHAERNEKRVCEIEGERREGERERTKKEKTTTIALFILSVPEIIESKAKN